MLRIARERKTKRRRSSLIEYAGLRPLYDQPLCPTTFRSPRLQHGADAKANLVAVGGWKHQRLDSDRNHLGNPQALTNIDIVQIANLDTINCNDIAINLEFVS